MKNINVIGLVVLSWAIGGITISIAKDVSANLDCSRLPAFHIMQLDNLIDCLNSRDTQQVNMIDATNDMIDTRLKPIELRLNITSVDEEPIRNTTDTTINPQPTNTTGIK